MVNHYYKHRLISHVIFLVCFLKVELLVAAVNLNVFTTTMLKSFQYGHMGGFTSSSFCPDNGRSFIIGTRVRLSNFLNQTYPTVNAMEFLCSDAITRRASANAILILQRNIGNWTEMKVCPNSGFVTGITLYMQPVSSAGLVAEEDVRNIALDGGQRAGHFFDIFDLGKSRYISGISLNCSWNQFYGNDFDGLMEEGGNEQGDFPLIPAWRNTVTLGIRSSMGLRLYCSENRVISGISVQQEALLSYDEGERWIPLEVITRCSLLTNPVKHCYPELDWEKVENMTCSEKATENASAPSSRNKTGPVNVTCHVPHFVGLSTNEKIENLKTILRAYHPVDLEGIDTKIVIRSKLLSSQFLNDWQHKYKLEMKEYKKAIPERSGDTYLKKTKETYVANFTNINYDEPEYCQLVRDGVNEPLEYEFNVKQLVGYCSIYKLHFPLFRNQFQVFFERKINGIRSRLIFPMVDESTRIPDILLESLLN